MINASQTSLRPILVNLAYYNKLRLPLLRGLARLLKLLASWFNVTLGEQHPHSAVSELVCDIAFCPGLSDASLHAAQMKGACR